MENEKINPQSKNVLATLYKAGSLSFAGIVQAVELPEAVVEDILEQLSEWGSVVKPSSKDNQQIWKAPAFVPSKRAIKKAQRDQNPIPVTYKEGQARPVENLDDLFEQELSVQYRSLPFWKRSVILLAGIAVNLVFAVILLILVFSVIGLAYIDKETGQPAHFTLPPWESVVVGWQVISTTFVAILGLFNPATAPEVVSQSSSIVGIAVMSADFFARGVADALFFMAVISVSVGLMNLLPIPPLDGGRFAIEVIQKIMRRPISARSMNIASSVGVALFLLFFIFMLNQDIQRFILGS